MKNTKLLTNKNINSINNDRKLECNIPAGVDILVSYGNLLLGGNLATDVKIFVTKNLHSCTQEAKNGNTEESFEFDVVIEKITINCKSAKQLLTSSPLDYNFFDIVINNRNNTTSSSFPNTSSKLIGDFGND